MKSATIMHGNFEIVHILWHKHVVATIRHIQTDTVFVMLLLWYARETNKQAENSDIAHATLNTYLWHTQNDAEKYSFVV